MKTETLLNEVITLRDDNLRSPHGIIEMQENLRRIQKNLDDKICDRCSIYISVKSKVPMNAFELASQFRDYTDWLVWGEDQISELNIESFRHDGDDEITIIINKA